MATVIKAEIFETTYDDVLGDYTDRIPRHLNGVEISPDGNELIFGNTSGICLTAPNGTKFRLKVDNLGVLITEEVT